MGVFLQLVHAHYLERIHHLGSTVGYSLSGVLMYFAV